MISGLIRFWSLLDYAYAIVGYDEDSYIALQGINIFRRLWISAIRLL
jgi:hypothetical protein